MRWEGLVALQICRCQKGATTHRFTDCTISAELWCMPPPPEEEKEEAAMSDATSMSAVADDMLSASADSSRLAPVTAPVGDDDDSVA